MHIILYFFFVTSTLAPVIKSPGNFVLEELTPDHVQPVRHKKSNVRHKKKAIFISDSKFSECLRNPSDLLQPVSVCLIMQCMC